MLNGNFFVLPEEIHTEEELDAYLRQLGRHMVSIDGLGRKLVLQFCQRATGEDLGYDD
jgi:hypothetical protein